MHRYYSASLTILLLFMYCQNPSNSNNKFNQYPSLSTIQGQWESVTVKANQYDSTGVLVSTQFDSTFRFAFQFQSDTMIEYYWYDINACYAESAYKYHLNQNGMLILDNSDTLVLSMKDDSLSIEQGGFACDDSKRICRKEYICMRTDVSSPPADFPKTICRR
jgi:hypothetical protein